MIDYTSCWNCKKSFSEISPEKRKGLIKDKIYFHCSGLCMNKCKLYNYKLIPLKWDDVEEPITKAEVELVDSPKKQYKCKACGKLGHNSRTCKESKE